MAEYIDREDALKIIESYSRACTEEGKVVAEAIKDIIAVITPTLDVVPREEVERTAVLDSYMLQYGTVKDQHGVIERIKQETAREIFACLEPSFAIGEFTGSDVFYAIRAEDYNRCKKKYTEDGK